MLKQVVVETANPMSFDIENADPDELIVVTGISGLDPADVTLFMGEFAQKGGYYQGRRAGRRNPVINVKINPNYAENISAAKARDLLYRTFLEPQADTDGVQIRLVSDDFPDLYFIGYTEKLPAGIFEKDPRAQISMICTDPYLKSVEETIGSNAAGWLAVPVNYDGSADTGIALTIKVIGTTSEVNIQNNSYTMTLEGAFVADDIIEVNTNQGSRSIKLNGVDVMATLTGSSVWLSLTQSDNVLRVFGDSGVSDGLAVVTEYSYRSEWWGM